jgi:Transglycosylase SLT domain
MRHAIAWSLLLALANFAAAQANEPQLLPGQVGSSDGTILFAEAGTTEPRVTDDVNVSTICRMIEHAAAANSLPFDFFAKIIWQESSFRPNAVGPVTRSGLRAQGIAQFMPFTAAERLLVNPFDPAEALPKSAEFLNELQAQFGNLGLAAAAYNAGSQRVHDWLAGRRALPLETRAYVRGVTGHVAEAWIGPQAKFLTIAGGEIPCGPRNPTAIMVATRRPPIKPAEDRPTLPWGVQLIGDRSEHKALAAYRQLQRRHGRLLEGHQPIILRLANRVGAFPMWTRIRVEARSREIAEALCSSLRVAGGKCLVQRN